MTGLIQILRSFTKSTALAAGLGATLALGAPMIASAQGGGGVVQADHGHGRGHGRGFGHRRGGGMMAHRFERMSAELGLTDAQQQQIRAVFQQARQERQALRQQAPEQRGQAMRELHQRVRDQIQGILTPAQQAQARALRAQHGEARGEHRIERMRERLGLTPEQETQIRGIFEGARNEREQIRQSQLAPEARQRMMQALGQRTRDAMRQVLTPAQQQQMQQHMGRHRHGRGFGGQAR